jgi:hypothetical protein
MVRGRQRARPQPTRTQSARGGRTPEPRLRASEERRSAGFAGRCPSLSRRLEAAEVGEGRSFRTSRLRVRTSAIRQA